MENEKTNIVPQDNGKVVAIVSYFSLLGWIIAYVINNGNKTSLGSYHLRQSLMLLIVSVVFTVLYFILAFIPYIGWIIGSVLGLGLFILWVIGLVNAINEQEKPVPVIGDKANDMLKGVA